MINIPQDMRCKEQEKKLADQGMQCSSVVSIRDLLILLGHPKDKDEDEVRVVKNNKKI